MKLWQRNKTIKAVEDVQHLAERLSKVPQVTRFSEDANEEAWGLADAFADIEGSMRIFLEVQLPKLTQNELSPAEAFDVLLDIAEEFRHILYHIHDQKFFDYLEPTHEWLQVSSRSSSKKRD
jgi:hypothetical protein